MPESIQVNIGKTGITPGSVTHIAASLRRAKEIRVRFLKSFLETMDREEAAAHLLRMLGADRVEKKLVGHVLILRKKHDLSAKNI